MSFNQKSGVAGRTSKLVSTQESREIYEYTKSHTLKEAAEHFGLSVSGIKLHSAKNTERVYEVDGHIPISLLAQQMKAKGLGSEGQRLDQAIRYVVNNKGLDFQTRGKREYLLPERTIEFLWKHFNAKKKIDQLSNQINGLYAEMLELATKNNLTCPPIKDKTARSRAL